MSRNHTTDSRHVDRVSVVITSYNQKRYLAEAIDSVIAQTHTPHEILIADDCSTDGSQDLIRQYVRRFPGLAKGIFHISNQFIPRNRNSALRKATGDYVLILDGDDRLLPTNLERQIQAIRNVGGRACSYTNMHHIDSRGQRTGIRDSGAMPSGEIFNKIAAGLFGIMRSMVMPLDAVKAAGLMNKAFPTYDGFVLTLYLARQMPILYIDIPLAEYRLYPDSDSKKTPFRTRLRHLRTVYRFVQQEISRLPPCEIKEIEEAWERIFSKVKAAAIRETHTGVQPFTDHKMIFLISQPRAGSTLLQMILAGHPRITTTSEPWLALPPLFTLRDHGLDAIYDASYARKAILGFLRSAGIQENTYRKHLAEFLLSVYAEATAGKPDAYFLDKTPRYYLIIRELAELFPNAKFILLFRNPAFVLASMLNSWVKDNILDLRRYREDLLTAPAALEDASRFLGERAHCLTYEAMLQGPEASLCPLFTFLGLDFDYSFLKYGNRIPANWIFGDSIGVPAHSTLEPSKPGPMHLMNRTHQDLAAWYIRRLGHEKLARMGYAIDSTLQAIENAQVDSQAAPTRLDWDAFLAEPGTLDSRLGIAAQALLATGQRNATQPLCHLTDWLRDPTAMSHLGYANLLEELFTKPQLDSRHDLHATLDSTQRQVTAALGAYEESAQSASQLSAAYVLARLETFKAIHGPHSRLALFGNGKHTHWLLSILASTSWRSRIVCILDDQAASGSFHHGIPVLNPADADASTWDILIPSSDTYEEELAARIRELFGQTTPLWRLYGGRVSGALPKPAIHVGSK